RADVAVEEFALDPDSDSIEQLGQFMAPEQQRVDLRSAPLIRLKAAQDVHSTQCFALLQMHHIVSDHVTVESIISEVASRLEGRELPPPSLPYRNHVAQALA